MKNTQKHSIFSEEYFFPNKNKDTKMLLYFYCRSFPKENRNNVRIKHQFLIFNITFWLVNIFLGNAFVLKSYFPLR